jgi:hypothetical protein
VNVRFRRYGAHRPGADTAARRLRFALEPSLHEVLIEGEGGAEIEALHDGERDAVGEGEFLTVCVFEREDEVRAGGPFRLRGRIDSPITR